MHVSTPNYRTRAIITHGLYIFYPIQEQVSNLEQIMLAHLWYAKKYDFYLQLEKVFDSVDITGSEQINDSCRFEP